MTIIWVTVAKSQGVRQGTSCQTCLRQQKATEVREAPRIIPRLLIGVHPPKVYIFQVQVYIPKSQYQYGMGNWGTTQIFISNGIYKVWWRIDLGVSGTQEGAVVRYRHQIFATQLLGSLLKKTHLKNQGCNFMGSQRRYFKEKGLFKYLLQALLPTQCKSETELRHLKKCSL